jgi:dipeptidyl aminopeptidase/acylaminoacyl peptidase
MNKYLLFFTFLIFHINQLRSQTFTLKSVLSYPFPSELVAAPTGSKIAWAMNEQGKRNIYVAEGPAYTPHKLTAFDNDDGQEITSIRISADGEWVTFVRGGDHSSREGSNPVNVMSQPIATKVQVMCIPYKGGKVTVVGEGDAPLFSPDSKRLLFTRNGQYFEYNLNESASIKTVISIKGNSGSATWSPDGTKMAFVSQRGDHSFIGIYTDQETPIQWLLPSFSQDLLPAWSADSKNIAFIRTPGTGGAPDSLLSRKHQPWSIWKVHIQTGIGKQIWKAPETIRGSYPAIDGGTNLQWAFNRILYTSYEDGWPHLYSVDFEGKQQLCLTPGQFAVENIKLSTDKKWLVFSANTGKNTDDIDRRHLYKVSVDQADMEPLTLGKGMETYPAMTNDGLTIAFLSATAQQPLLPAILSIKNKKINLLGKDLIPNDFPVQELITPEHVTFTAPDGKTVYAQLFKPKSSKANKAAIVYVHGGPQRQMVLGWHHMDYYSIDYALNQYLVSQGFTVLSVNYRLGTGYGFDFHKPLNAGAQGASEYQDIKAAGEWLAKQSGIDDQKIGIYGGSYGGYLVALALGKDSKLFAAGVDIHGVHNRFSSFSKELQDAAPDGVLAAKKSLESAPISYLNTWTSPTLLIHADDDRNVNFSQTVDLARRFEDRKFLFEYLSIPDDTHHWMKFSNALKVSEATAEFLQRKLLKKSIKN